MNRYPNYTATNLPWLSEVPAHWKIGRAKRMFKKEARLVRESDGIITCFRDGMVTLRANRRTTGFTEAIQEIGYQGIRKGDLVIHVMDAFAGAIGVSDSDGKGSPVYSVCTSIGDYNNHYFARILRIMANTGFIQSLYRGIRERSSDFRFDVFANQFLPIPPRSEQDQIVRYLDWQTSRINGLIAAKRREIELLRECRSGFIDDIVLHGTNQTVQQKNSGVNWIGDIPQHWEVIPLKRVCRVNASIVSMLDDVAEDFPVVFLPMENVSVTGEIDCSIKKPLKDVKTGFSSFAKNDVIVAKITPCFENGKGACLDSLDGDFGFGSTEFINIRPTEKILSEFLYYLTITRPFRVLGADEMTGSAGQKRISAEFIKDFIIALPPIDEQREIVAYIKEKSAKIDSTVAGIERQISLLHELRTRLISDVVTGQIDVRGVTVPEFESIAEPPDDSAEEESAEYETEE